MEKKKILILCASLKIGGAEKVAQSIALYAPENTFEFHMVGKSAVYPDDPQSGRLELSIQWPEDFRFNT